MLVKGLVKKLLKRKPLQKKPFLKNINFRGKRAFLKKRPVFKKKGKN